MLGLRDDFPPYSPGIDPSAVTLTIPYPEKSSRGWAIMTILPLKWIALISQVVVLYALMLAMLVVWYISQWAVLFTGKFPEGMHRFIVGVTRWSTRVSAFSLGLRNEYPPFSMS